ncbi:MAG: zinc ribbon domain-containing protein [Oscillospiraceae bacterium]|jgi:hypothetical protein|nr:zinc ribbon domain-containing protein [Oscillospiraceae bacterium]MDE6899646.1 zinc ribbon domain-containing protein [Oscillospiraceae bacterium]
MAFCKKCGAQIDDQAVVCPKCGVAQGAGMSTSDNGGFLWGLLGCCIPLVGLILFLVWKDTKPKTSKAAGIGALVGVLSIVVWYIVAIVIGLGAAFM